MQSLISKEGIMKKVALLFGLFLFGTVLSAEEKINLMTEIFPSYQYYDEDLTLSGISIEIIEAVKREIKNQAPKQKKLYVIVYILDPS